MQRWGLNSFEIYLRQRGQQPAAQRLRAPDSSSRLPAQEREQPQAFLYPNYGRRGAPASSALQSGQVLCPSSQGTTQSSWYLGCGRGGVKVEL